jgi:eukaryotic-like serine/threonine-protein kinase
MTSPLAQLTPETWPAVSALLDEALALDPAERAAFVQQLDGERAQYRDTLRQLLAQATGVETDDFLATLPRIAAGGSAATEPFGEPAAGAMVGPYRLLSELGAGGMGTVWLAERADGTLKRRVALKLPRLAWGRGLAERMARERDILASLEHPHIARLYDAGVDQHGRPYLALEYVEGQPIDAYARERGLSARARLDLLLQVAAAVAFAHSRLVVHRDLKPTNILVTANGQVRLLDFGIAKLMEGDRTQETQLTQVAGRALTIDYASPEQIKGEPIGTASDVYTLGVVAYELLTGSKPYKLRRGSAAELEEAIATVDAPKASEASGDVASRRALRGDLDAILNKALKKAPADRYTTVDAFAHDIARHFASEPVSAQPDAFRYRAAKFLARYRLQVTAGSLVLVAVLAGTGVAVWQAHEARRAGSEALAQATRAGQQADRAEAVKQFLIALFAANDLNQRPDSERRALTAERLLLEGAARINDGFAAQPELRAELHGVVGQLMYDLRLLEPAKQALEARAEFLDGGGGSPAERAATWLTLARINNSQSNPQRVEAALQRAMAAGAQASTLQDHLAHWSAVIEYASVLDDRGKPDEAFAHIERARDALRHLAPASVEYAFAVEVRASFELMNYGRDAEGIKGLEEALAIYESLHAQQPVDLARIYLRYGNYLMDVDDARAEALIRSGLKMMQEHAGPDHPSTVRGMLRLAQLLVVRGEPQEARPLLMTVLQHAEAAPTTFRSDVRYEAYRYLAHAHFDEGRAAEGRSWAEKYSIAATGEVERAIAQGLLARSLQATGDYIGAAAALQRTEALFASNTPPESSLFAQLKVRLAETLWHRGQVESAREALLGVVDREGPASLQQAVDAARLLMGRIALAEGQPAEAIRWITPAHERTERLAPSRRGRVREIAAALPLAEALIAAGRTAEAKPLVARSLALAEPMQAQGTLRLQLALVASRLAVAEGRVDEARRYARSARDVIAAEPRIAPHYREAMARVYRDLSALRR